jgi:hypothetical protein
VFEDFVVLQKFIRTASPRYVKLIRRLGFIINAGDAEVYSAFQHAYACQPNALDLFRQFKSLQHLEVNVYLCHPTPIPVWPILDFTKIAMAFSRINIPDILFRVPRPMWSNIIQPVGADNNGNDGDNGGIDDDNENDDNDEDHSGDSDGNDVVSVNVVGAITALNTVVMFGGTAWDHQHWPQVVPTIPSNALQQYQNMTLVRPVLRERDTCIKYADAGSDGIRPWGAAADLREEPGRRLSRRLQELLRTWTVSE